MTETVILGESGRIVLPASIRKEFGMAPGERNGLMVLARRLASEQGIGVLFTEHSMDVVFAHADRIIVLARGELIAAGPPAAVRDDARVREVYFGGGTTFAPIAAQPGEPGIA